MDYVNSFAFGVYERKVLRKILDGKLENDVRCRCMNHELYQMYKEANIN